jgi:hypothetical protein
MNRIEAMIMLALTALLLLGIVYCFQPKTKYVSECSHPRLELRCVDCSELLFIYQAKEVAEKLKNRTAESKCDAKDSVK